VLNAERNQTTIPRDVDERAKTDRTILRKYRANRAKVRNTRLAWSAGKPSGYPGIDRSRCGQSPLRPSKIKYSATT